jgi:hypothetical protein
MSNYCSKVLKIDVKICLSYVICKNYLLLFDFHYLENKLYEETFNFSFVTFKNPVMHKIIMLFVVDNRHF